MLALRIAATALTALAALYGVTQVGKYRKPLTAGDVIGTMVVAALYIWLWWSV